MDKPLSELARQQRYEGLAEEHAKGLRRRRRKHLAALLHLPPGNVGRERLELMVEYMVERVRMVTSKSYIPPSQASSNPAVDAILLFYMVLPAVVCTADRRFVNSVRVLKSPDRIRVMLPSELIAWLRDGLLPL